jgi:insertion element IS1 protein InsB
MAPDPEDAASTTLELDELWSLVLKKANHSWIWIALCRQTRQVVAYVVGDQSKMTCQRLWEAIAEGYRQGFCFTDFWGAYAAVIPATQHSAVGKVTGETDHVDRWNNTLRQRLTHFVRMTLSFSKSVVMLRPRVCSFFSIATIESGPSCLSEPLPASVQTADIQTSSCVAHEEHFWPTQQRQTWFSTQRKKLNHCLEG